MPHSGVNDAFSSSAARPGEAATPADARSSLEAEVDELRRALASARKSEDQFAKAFHSSADALIISRLSDGAIIAVNESYLRLVGYEEADLLGKNRHTLRLAVDMTARDRLVGLLVDKGSFRDEPIQLRQQSGAVRDVLNSAETFDVGGEIRVLARIRDVTEQRAAERALEASDQRLRMALTAAKMGIWEWEIPTDRVIWSAEVSSIYGLDAVETARTVADFLERIHADDRPATHKRLVELIDRRQQDDSYDEEHRILWPNGEVRWVVSKGSVMFDDDGNPLRIIGTVMDATERKQAEEQAQQYLTDLWRMGRIRTADQTALSLAHELNQPLTAISLQAGIVASLAQTSGVPLSADLESALREISEQAQRGGAIIRALRDLVKRGATRREPAQVNDIVREVVRLVEAQARQRHAAIALALDELPLINVDRIQVAQVLMNLLQNALDALRDSEPELRSIEISTRTNVADNTVEVAVHDSGPGVPPDIGERVFDRFYTTKTDGIGLGLAIARSIAEAHEGKLWMEPAATGGTTFRFCLPIPAPAAAMESQS
ncbi:MAG TPA: ATP-binding protein [Pirellulales bacterium]